MPASLTPTSALITAVEISLWAIGLIVLWRVQFSGKTRAQREHPALPSWDLPLTTFFQRALCVLVGAWFFPLIVTSFGRHFPGMSGDDDLRQLILGTAFQLGMLAGILGPVFFLRHSAFPVTADPVAPAPRRRFPLLAGVATFLIALPIVTWMANVWKTVLDVFHLNTDMQELVDIFQKAGNSPGRLAVLTVLAVAVAPLTEELIFRAGLFRYLRTRVPRWIALPVPAALFAALHGNLVAFVPLFLLGVLFSLAYERTGRIAVTIVAHGLFNLHTLLLILAGVTA
ncbi:MAG: CPBP family intramembrane metalloprotease [Verrucomicrobia bacterium]|nr:CPBP family intramembrane metalloprotease [Verrucomicrobiota bacterium]